MIFLMVTDLALTSMTYLLMKEVWAKITDQTKINQIKMRFCVKFSSNIQPYDNRKKEDCDCIRSRTTPFGYTKNVLLLLPKQWSMHFARLNFVYNNNYMAAIKVYALCITGTRSFKIVVELIILSFTYLKKFRLRGRHPPQSDIPYRAR